MSPDTRPTPVSLFLHPSKESVTVLVDFTAERGCWRQALRLDVMTRARLRAGVSGFPFLPRSGNAAETASWMERRRRTQEPPPGGRAHGSLSAEELISEQLLLPPSSLQKGRQTESALCVHRDFLSQAGSPRHRVGDMKGKKRRPECGLSAQVLLSFSAEPWSLRTEPPAV